MNDPTYEASLRVMFDLCPGNPDTYGYQDDIGGFFRRDEPLTPTIIEFHVRGQKSILIYPILPDKKHVRFCAFDLDDPRHKQAGFTRIRIPNMIEPRRKVRLILSKLIKKGISPSYIIITDSGGGLHLWIPFKEKVLAKDVRLFFYHHVLRYFKKGDFEFFPKHNELNGKHPVGFGIRFEGYHKKRKCWSTFLNADLNEIDSIKYIKPLDFYKKLTPEFKGLQMMLQFFDLFLKFKIQKPEFIHTKPHEGPRNLRSCIPWYHATKKPLTGGNGHKLRFSVAKELYLFYEAQGCALEENIEKIVEWFQCQNDADPDKNGKTYYQVQYLIKREVSKRDSDPTYEIKPYRCETILKFGFCMKTACSRYRYKMKFGEINGKQ